MLRTVQLATRASRMWVPVRAFSGCSVHQAASLFAMPAMSPTMEQGGIVEWKFKEGESFSQGDVLLEIETDKANIDVEAQDDGVLAKIFVPNGAKDIAVGQSIAAVAEPGDDLATLAIPEPTTVSKEVAKDTKAETKVEAKVEPKSEPEANTVAKTRADTDSGPSKAQTGNSKANPAQTLLPSVQSLLTAHGISKADALAQIPVTGPNGRMLKGDVLVHLGAASAQSLTKLNSELSKLRVLDLSNISLKPRAVEAPKPEAPVEVHIPVVSESFSLADLKLLQIAAQASSGKATTLDTLVQTASQRARADVLRRAPPSDAFAALTAVSPRGEPFSVQLTYSSGTPKTSTKDIYDILSSSRPASRPVVARAQADTVTVSAKINPDYAGSEDVAVKYVGRLGYYLNQGTAELV